MTPSYYQELLYFNQYIGGRAGILTDMPELDDPHPEWPPGILFRPGYDIKWQYDFIARMFFMDSGVILAADMGLGKSVMGAGLAAVAFEQQVIDHVLVVCEKNKLTEWAADFGRFTRLAASLYYGPKRKGLLGGLPQAVVTTYETARDDVAVFPPKKSRSRTIAPGPLAQALSGKRVLVIYDEVTKVGHGRDSKLYKAHHWLVHYLRKSGKGSRVIGLTGTPMETDLEGMFNEMRVVVPSAMPTVAEFEREVVRSRDIYGRPTYTPHGRLWFRERCDPYILRKRKSDEDVRDQFPPLMEEFRRLQMGDDQYKLYRMLEDLAWTPDGERQEVPGLQVLLRLMAGDPLAVLESAASERSELAVAVAEELGGDLERCSSAKAQELVSTADIVMSGGGKLMAFTFFAHTVMPVLQRRLSGRTVFTYHGGMTQAERDRQLALFEACEGGAVLLASDAAARGINVPFVDVIAEYEAASKHATRVQRASRGHRLGRANPLTFVTFVLESSIEASSNISSVLSRNADQDFMLHDDEADGFTTADDRRELYAQARPRKAA
jgi:superfamily II DNA or RNA helicase